MEDTPALLENNCVFQQDDAPAHGVMQTQQWLGEHGPSFIDNDSWPPNSPDLNPLDYCTWGAMLEEFNKFNSKPQNNSELKIVQQMIWDKLSDETIRQAIISLNKRLNACVIADGAHFEHSIS